MRSQMMVAHDHHSGMMSLLDGVVMSTEEPIATRLMEICRSDMWPNFG